MRFLFILSIQLLALAPLAQGSVIKKVAQLNEELHNIELELEIDPDHRAKNLLKDIAPELKRIDQRIENYIDSYGAWEFGDKTRIEVTNLSYPRHDHSLAGFWEMIKPIPHYSSSVSFYITLPSGAQFSYTNELTTARIYEAFALRTGKLEDLIFDRMELMEHFRSATSVAELRDQFAAKIDQILAENAGGKVHSLVYHQAALSENLEDFRYMISNIKADLPEVRKLSFPLQKEWTDTTRSKLSELIDDYNGYMSRLFRSSPDKYAKYKFRFQPDQAKFCEYILGIRVRD